MTDKHWPSPDQLIDWAMNEPDKLERFKEREIAKLIDQTSEPMKRRLRGLQFQIDCQRKLHANPIASCIAISKMMLESLDELNNALHGNTTAKEESLKRQRAHSSRVIPFRAVTSQVPVEA